MNSPTLLHEALSCKTAKGKAAFLVSAAVISCLLAVGVDVIYYLAAGPTTAGTWYNRYWILYFAAAIFAVFGFIAFRHDLGDKPERCYLVVVLAFTLSASVATDIQQVSWDVEHHFKFMLSWTEPDLSIEETAAEEFYTTQNKNLNMSSDPDYVFKPYTISDTNGIRNMLNESDGEMSASSISGSATAFYNRVASIPGSCVWAIADAMGLSFALKYLLARLPYALIYSLVTYFGMKHLRSGKMLYAAVALMPVALFLAANYSYDYWINCFMLYAVARLVGEMQTPNKPLPLKSAVFIFLSFILACGPKPIYAPLVLLCMMMPRSKFTSSRLSRGFRVAAVAVMLLIAASYLLPFLSSNPGSGGDTRGGSDVSVGGQFAFIASDPLNYLAILFGFIPSSLLGAIQATDLLAYAGQPSLPVWAVYALALAFVAATDRGRCDQKVCTWKTRAWTTLLTVGMICLIVTALYLDYTPVGLSTVNGVQPRYYIPLVFGLLFFWGFPKLGSLIHAGTARYNAITLGVLSVLPFITFWQTFLIYVA